MIGSAAQRLMELEVGEVTGAALVERSPDRLRDFLARPIEGDWPYLWLDAA